MKRKLKGFTLVELIVVMVIMSILMLAVMNMFKPIRNMYVDSTQYEAQRTAQTGVVQYITESIRFATDVGIYNSSITSASTAVDEFAKQYCINSGITDATGNAVAPYTTAELNSIKDEIKKYADVIIIDNSTPHTYGSKTYSGRLIRRKFPATPTSTVPSDPALTSSATSDWRIALSEAYYGGNTFSINLSVTDSNHDGKSDDGMLNIAVASTRNGKRDISNMGKENTLTGTVGTSESGQVTRGGVLCRNLVAGDKGVTKAGIFDVSKYSGSSATAGAKTYIVFLNIGEYDNSVTPHKYTGKRAVDVVVKAAAATP